MAVVEDGELGARPVDGGTGHHLFLFGQTTSFCCCLLLFLTRFCFGCRTYPIGDGQLPAVLQDAPGRDADADDAAGAADARRPFALQGDADAPADARGDAVRHDPRLWLVPGRQPNPKPNKKKSPLSVPGKSVPVSETPTIVQSTVQLPRKCPTSNSS